MTGQGEGAIWFREPGYKIRQREEAARLKAAPTSSESIARARARRAAYLRPEFPTILDAGNLMYSLRIGYDFFMAAAAPLE